MEQTNHARPSLPPVPTLPATRTQRFDPETLYTPLPAYPSVLALPTFGVAPSSGVSPAASQAPHVSIPSISTFAFSPPLEDYRVYRHSPYGQFDGYQPPHPLGRMDTMNTMSSRPLPPLQSAVTSHGAGLNSFADLAGPYAFSQRPPIPTRSFWEEMEDQLPSTSGTQNLSASSRPQYPMSAQQTLPRRNTVFPSVPPTESSGPPPLPPFGAPIRPNLQHAPVSLEVRPPEIGAQQPPAQYSHNARRQHHHNPNRRSFQMYSVDLPEGRTSSHSEEAAARAPPSHRSRPPHRSRQRFRAHRTSYDPNVATPGQVEELKSKLPRKVLSELPAETSTDCDVCSKTYSALTVSPTEEQEIAVQLPCGHYFGEFCLLQWVCPFNASRFSFADQLSD